MRRPYPVRRLGSGTPYWYHSARQDPRFPSKYKAFCWYASPRSGRASIELNLLHFLTLFKWGSSWNRVGKFEGLKGRKARYFRDLLHFCRVQNLAQMLDGKDIETSSAALGYVFI